MNEQEIKEKLRSAAEAVTPNILDGLFAECKSQPVEQIVPMPRRNRTAHTVRILSIAASVALFFIVAFVSVFLLNRSAPAVNTTIYVDVNPSMEIQLDEKDNVAKIIALNEKAQTLIKNLEISKHPWDTAVNTIVNEMLREGYLNETTNSILFSIDDVDEESAAAFQQKLNQEVNTVFEQNEFDGSIICQTIEKSDGLVALAEKHGISPGKASLIQNMVTAAPKLSFEDLAQLSVNELKLLTETEQIPLQNTEMTGSASNSTLIKAEEAVAIAKENADIAKAAKATWELTAENGVLIYQVTLKTAEDTVICKIHAKNGTVLDEDNSDNSNTDTEPDVSTDSDITDTDTEPNVSTDSDITETDTEPDVSTDSDITDTDTEPDVSTDSDITDTDTEPDASDTNTDTEDPPITKEDAKKIAFSHAGLNANQVWYPKCDLNREADTYTVSFYTFTHEYKYVISAVSGEIQSAERTAFFPWWG